jgi:hypothetical protein
MGAAAAAGSGQSPKQVNGRRTLLPQPVCSHARRRCWVIRREGRLTQRQNGRRGRRRKKCATSLNSNAALWVIKGTLQHYGVALTSGLPKTQRHARACSTVALHPRTLPTVCTFTSHTGLT